MIKIKQSMPNILTLLSLFLGFSSILFAIQAVNDLYLHQIIQTEHLKEKADTFIRSIKLIETPNPKKYLFYSGLFIIFATFCDFLDGFTAKIFKTKTLFGKQLDSLSDLVSFGIAPGVLFYTVTLFAGEFIPKSGIVYYIPSITPNIFIENLLAIKLIAFLFPICVIIRLAYYNTKVQSKNYFSGLPSTYAGGMVALAFSFNFYLMPIEIFLKKINLTLPLNFNYISSFFDNFLFLFIIYVLLAILMLFNKIFFYKISFFLKRLTTKKLIFSFLIPFLFFGILFFKYFLLILALSYLIYCLFNYSFNFFLKK